MPLKEVFLRNQCVQNYIDTWLSIYCDKGFHPSSVTHEEFENSHFYDLIGCLFRFDPGSFDEEAQKKILHEVEDPESANCLRVCAGYMQNPDADPVVLKGILDKAKGFNEDNRACVYAGYVQNTAADPADLITVLGRVETFANKELRARVYAGYMKNPQADLEKVKEILDKASAFHHLDLDLKLFNTKPLVYAHYLDREGTDAEKAQEMIAEMQTTVSGQSLLNEIYARKRNKRVRGAQSMKRALPADMASEYEPVDKKQKTS